MRVIVTGHRGMLGHQLVKQLRANGHEVIEPTWVYDIAEPMVWPEADVLFNCAGVIPIKAKNNIDMIRANALGPHMTAQSFKGLIYHISTDCVFDSNYARTAAIHDKPDAMDVYGRSKALGEVDAPNVVNVRTSFIGAEHGLFTWVCDNNGNEIDGWRMAFWSGSTVQEVARNLASFLTPQPIHHLAATKLNKYEVIKFIIDALNLDIDVRAVNNPWIDRGLSPTVWMKSVLQLEDDIHELYQRYRASRSEAKPSTVSA